MSDVVSMANFWWIMLALRKAIFIISSWEATVRKEADVKEHDEGIAPAIAEERSLTDALCSRSFPDEIVKIADF